ncbi:MAG: YkvA family protein [Chloroflexota bacterium]
MFNQLNVLPQLWRSARLTLRLLRDSRVPILAKVVFYATVAYMLSPFDFVPDWIPVLGQADDLVAILAGLNLFFRVCPSWIVEEHEAEMDGRLGEPSDKPRATGPSRETRSTVEGTYRRMA